MWHRSSFCEGGHCIEVGENREGVPGVFLRSSTPGGGTFATLDEWRAFVAGVKAGDFDHIGGPDANTV